jgi:mRNA interferase HigB
MTITAAGKLDEFVERHPDAEGALAAWRQHAITASWKSLQEVKQTFRAADGVTVDSGRTITVFNIRGNNYRLLTAINYQTGVVIVREFLTHAEYDKEKWKRTL